MSKQLLNVGLVIGVSICALVLAKDPFNNQDPVVFSPGFIALAESRSDSFRVISSIMDQVRKERLDRLVCIEVEGKFAEAILLTRSEFREEKISTFRWISFNSPRPNTLSTNIIYFPVSYSSSYFDELIDTAKGTIREGRKIPSEIGSGGFVIRATWIDSNGEGSFRRWFGSLEALENEELELISEAIFGVDEKDRAVLNGSVFLELLKSQKTER